MSCNNVAIWAGIVAYHPDLAKLKYLINTLEKQVNRIVVYNNGGCLDDEISKLFHGQNFQIIGCGENVGIAKALNEICHLAVQNTADYIVTFDQDSAPGGNFVDGLYACMAELCIADKNVAAVGPVFVDKRGNNEIMPVFQVAPLWIKKINPLSGSVAPIGASILITSGMLLKIAAWECVGEFRDDYFIDHVDTEWCLRATAKGFELFVSPSVIMQHELSNEAPQRVFGRLVLKYNPIRRYYAFRNTMALIRMDYTPQGFRFYLLATICYRFFINLLVDKNIIKSLNAMLIGVVHGVVGRMGKWQ